MSLKFGSRIVTLLIAAALLSVALLTTGHQTVSAATMTCVQAHTVQYGETLWRISRYYETTVARLQAINGLGSSTRIYVGQRLCVKAETTDGGNQPGGTVYIVKRGDTLTRIARQFGVDMWVLARVNGISNPNRIYVGQRLIIPDVTIQTAL